MSKTYRGSCHCGKIRFEITTQPIAKGLRCNCSLCVRKGAMMTPFTVPPEDFRLLAGEQHLRLYQFGEKTARHYFCAHCGVYPFHQPARAPTHYRANLGCLEGVDPTQLEAELFDGKHLL